MDHPDSWKTQSSRFRKAVISATVAVPLCGLSVWLLLWRSPSPHLNYLPLTRQATNYTCGAASLQSVLAYYGEEWREDTLARELKSNPEQGTNYRELVRFARSQGLTAEVREGMTVDDLTSAAGKDRPVIVAIQAWGDHPDRYVDDWEDGHYSVVVGVDERNVYLMDPSTLGNYTYIPTHEFLARWHDAEIDPDGRMHKLIHFGIIFAKSGKPSYNPESLKPLQ